MKTKSAMIKSISNAIYSSKEKFKNGTCALCCNENIKFADSHTIPKSLLKNISHSGEVYYFEAVISYMKSFIHKIKNSDSVNIQDKIFSENKKQIRGAGVFNKICIPCENKIDDYENHIGENINYDLKDKDVTELAIKALLLKSYLSDLGVEVIKQLNIENPSNRLQYADHEKEIDKFRKLCDNAALNSFNGNKKWHIIWDSAKNNKKLNLKIALFHICKIPNPYNFTPIISIILPGDNGSRLIIISPKEITLKDITKSNDDKTFIKEVLGNSLKDYLAGIFISPNFDLKNFYDLIIGNGEMTMDCERLIKLIISNNKYQDTKSLFIK